MPRLERQIRPQSLVAAAKSYGTKRSRSKAGDSKRPGEEWQRAGWEFFDLIPEFHQGCMITGALLSRARLVVMEWNGQSWQPTQNPHAIGALDELYGGPEGHPEMLRQLGIHFSVAGEGWVIGPTKPKSVVDDWQVAAATAITRTGGTWKVNREEVVDSLIMRLWRPHPHDKTKADAPTRAILSVLSELNQLSKRVAAQIDSRLTGAGLLLLPSETEFPAAPSLQINPGEIPAARQAIAAGDAQGLADLILENARYAIEHPEDASAMIPLIATAPGEYIDKAQLLTFWSELDKVAPKLREELIRRLALGLDIPPEVLLGTSGSNHWNAWLSDENSVKIHAEPLLKLITTSLTSEYLRKALDGLVDDPKKFSIQADTSQMRLRPNRSREAIELHDRLILSNEAVLRENGFELSDLMSDEERQVALIRKVASGSTTPELVEAALRQAGVELDVVVADRRDPAEARPTPTLTEHPARELPERPDAASAHLMALTLVSEQILDRALQRAGNRMKTRLGLRDSPFNANRLYMATQMTAADMDAALQDAWTSCHEFDYGVDPVLLEKALDTYARSLIRSQREPSRAGLTAILKLMLDRSAA